MKFYIQNQTLKEAVAYLLIGIAFFIIAFFFFDIIMKIMHVVFYCTSGVLILGSITEFNNYFKKQKK